MALPLFSIKGHRSEFIVNMLCCELRKSHSNHFHIDQESLVFAVSLPLAFFPVSTTFLFFPIRPGAWSPRLWRGLQATESLPKSRRERKGVDLILVFFINAIHNSHRIFLSSLDCKIFLALKRTLKEYLKKQDAISPI